MKLKKRNRTLTLAASLLWAASATVAFAQGASSARVSIAKPIQFAIVPGEWDSQKFRIANTGREWGGRVSARAGHGTIQSDSLHQASSLDQFETYARSTAAKEFAETKNAYEFTSTRYGTILKQLPESSFSISEATAEAGDDERYAFCVGSTFVSSTFQIKRVTQGLISPPSFFASVVCSEASATMNAVAFGNASAVSEIELALFGRIYDRNARDARWIDLEPQPIFSEVIKSNANWRNSSIVGRKSLALPTWTGMTGANFDLELGLKFRAHTYARAVGTPVPEPAGIIGMLLGAGVLARVRRRSFGAA